MSWRALTLGFLCGCGLGIGLGWLVFATEGDPVPITIPAPRSASVPRTPPSLQGTGTTALEPARADVVDLTRVLQAGTGAEVASAAAAVEPPFEDGAIEAAVARLAEARSSGDWSLFRALLQVLGRADTREADRALVAVIGDETLSFPGPIGRAFHAWLAGSEVPGIVEATRRRLEQNASDGDTSWGARHGWVDLVADHGTQEDIAWLLVDVEDPIMRNDGAVAVAKSKSPVATQWMRDALVLPMDERGRRAGWGRSYPQALGFFVRAHGDGAFDVVAEILERQLAGESVLTNMDVDKLFGMYGSTVPKEREAEAVRRLQGFRTEATQMAAVKAVLSMRRRGIDVSGLEPILDAPLNALRRMAGGEEQAGEGTVDAYTALYAIEYNPGLWSEETAGALEAAGRALMGKASAAANMIEVAKEVRAGLRSPWRRE